MTEYTPAQRKLIEKHRDWNVDHDWYDCTIGDFCEVAKSFGIDVERKDVQFSGFWSQGDGASFTFGTVNAYDVIMAAIKVEESGEYGPGGYADEFKALGNLLLDAFSPYVLTCPEGAQLAEAYCFMAERTGHHYSHSNTVTVRTDEPDLHRQYDPESTDAHQQVWNALYTKLFGVQVGKHEWERKGSLEDELDDAVKAIADALYKSLEKEFYYLTSDEAVWESLEANGVEPEDEGDEDDEEETDEDLAESA